jgi:hypothetical protein
MELIKYTLVLIILTFIGCKNSNLNEKKIYFDNGKLKEKYFIDKKNRRQGFSYIYYPNGKLSTKAKFKDEIQIDTTFHYLDNGHLDAIAIYDKNGKTIKEIAFFPNNKINVIRSFFVDGAGEINAYKTFFENGTINESESDFVKLEFYGKNKDSMRVRLYNCKFTDSVRVNFIRSFNFKYSFESQVIRSMTFSNTKDLKFKILKSDFVKNKVNIQILTEKWISSKLVKVNNYPIQISKGTLPRDKVEGIYKIY